MNTPPIDAKLSLFEAIEALRATDPRAIKAVARTMRQAGILAMEFGPLKLTLSPTPLTVPGKPRGKSASKDLSGRDVPDTVPLSEEDLLFWSSGGAPEAPAPEPKE